MFAAIALPTLIVALFGVALVWRATDAAVRESTEAEAVGLADFVATSFGTVDEGAATGAPRVAHRAVTAAIRNKWAALKFVNELRVIDSKGVVRWSRRIEEEDKPFPEAARLLAVNNENPKYVGSAAPWPWSRGGGEVVQPIGGVACAGCHTGESTMRTGVLQLTVDEPSLRHEVSDVFSRALWVMLIFALVLVVAVSVSLRIFLVRPLGRLTALMKKAEAGDVVVRAPVENKDEIGRLAKAFNNMLARLTEMKVSEIDQQRDLEKARADLQLHTELEKLNHRLNSRLEELSTLFELARAVTSTLDLEEVLSRITALVPMRVGVPKFSIMLINADGLLEVMRAVPPGIGSEGLTFSVGEGVCGRAAEIGKSVYVPDLQKDTRFKLRGVRNAAGSGCLLSVPMVNGGQVLGVLNFERPTRADFSSEEIEFYMSVADQAALAVQNAKLHEQTVSLSVTDPLTGVPNRRYLFQQLEAEINRANRFGTQLSMLMIDIDYFKRLNDNAGHQAGDVALRKVSQILKHSIRKVDTLGRYGGEEFVVLLPQVPRVEALEVAEKLRKAVEDEHFEHAHVQPNGKVTISIGVSSLPGDATELEKLVDSADAALYASKRGGRNLVHAYALGMELHPGRERGPTATAKKITGEIPVVKADAKNG